MKTGFQVVQLGPNTPLPQNEYFHTSSWTGQRTVYNPEGTGGSLNISDAPEDSTPGESQEMSDMEVTQDDRLIRAPGVTPTETLDHAPTQVVLHAGFQYASAIVFLAPPFVGVKSSGNTAWFDAGLIAGTRYGTTNFAGILLLTNGSKGIYFREPNKLTLGLIPNSPPGFGLAVFANRVVVGGAQIDGKLDFMGLAWSDSTSDFKGWDIALGAGNQSMIGTMHRADRFQAFGSIGFETLAVLNRRSIWIGVQTGDEFQPIRFSPRLEDTGCSHPETAISTEYGVLFLSDDGVRLFTGNSAEIISGPINRLLGPINEADHWAADFDPFRKRYYLHSPTATWVFDLVHKRWFKWNAQFLDSVFFPSQGTQITWGQAVGTWGAQTLAWWQLLPQETGGRMYFVRGTGLGYEDPASFTVFGTPLNPLWFDRVQVADNQDTLMTSLGVRLAYESEISSQVEVWLPDKPDGNYEPIVQASLAPLVAGKATKRVWIPFIHTGRSIGMGLRILSGSPRIRRASVEFQRTGMLWEGTFEAGGFFGDAIMRPRILFTNGFETEGQVWRTNFTPDPLSTTHYQPSSGGNLVWHETGGRDNGGYVTTVASTVLDGFGNLRGQYQALWSAPGEPAGAGSLNQRGGCFAFNLFGRTLTQPMNFVGVGQQLNFDAGQSFIATTMLRLMPDLSIQAAHYGSFADGSGVGFTPIGPASELKVPADGWWQIEVQFCGGISGNNTSGFILARLYTEGGPIFGTSVVDQIGVDVGVGFFADTSGIAWGTEVCGRLSQGLTGVGIDDVIVYGPYGNVKRFIGDTHVGIAVPSAPGDLTSSTISWDSRRTFGPHGGPPTTENLGVNLTHGSVDRWRNVTGKPARSASELLNRLDALFPGGIFGAPIASVTYGNISPFTGNWLLGPFIPPRYGDPTLGNAFADTDETTLIRNTYQDANLELYHIATNRTNIVKVEGIFPYSRAGIRFLIAGIGGGNILGDPAAEFNLVSLHSLALDETGNNSSHYHYVNVIRVGGVDWVSEADSASAHPSITTHAGGGDIATPGQFWRTRPMYGVAPYSFIDLNPATSVPFEPGEIPAIQVGFRGDTTQVNLGPPSGSNHHWVQVDSCEVGFDICYHPIDAQYIEHDPFAPLAGFVFISGNNFPGRHIVLKDTSTDWDGTVVNRVIDWGDGTATQAISAGGTLTHDYAVPGSYSLTETVTDNDGLVGTKTVVIPAYIVNQPPVPAFSFARDPGDVTNKTADFTDASTDDHGIISRVWNFGDGSAVSTATNPVHAYAAAGTYIVNLAVTDGGGEGGQLPLTRSINLSVVIPLPGGGGGGGSQVNMPIVFSDSMNFTTINQSVLRWDFTGGLETVVVGGGRDGGNAITEGGTFGIRQYTCETSQCNPRAVQFVFDLQGATLPAQELPLCIIGNNAVACVLRPDHKVRVYAYNGIAWAQAFETAAPVPSTGLIHTTIHWGFGAAGVGFVALRINGEALIADPIAVNPGQTTMVGSFITFCTGSAGNYNFPITGFHGIATVRWCDIAFFDDTGSAHADHPGDVHFSVCLPQAIGTYNDSGGSAANVQVADEGTTKNTFTAANQKDTFTLNTPTGTMAVILAVLPFYEGGRGGTTSTRTWGFLVKSGATLAQSPDVAASSSYTTRYHVNPSDTIDRWILLTDPATGLAWANAAAVGACEVGAKAVTISVAGGTLLVSQLGLEVAYWATSPPPGGTNFAKSDFESGLYDPPFAISGVQGIVTVVSDPTPRATGKVLDIYYENFPEGGNYDCNQAIAPPGLSRGLGEDLWCRWKFYLDTDGTEPAIRKFNYWGWSNAGWGFQHPFNLVIASANSVLPPIPPGTPIQFLISAHLVQQDGTQIGCFGPGEGNAGPGTWYGPGIDLKTWHEIKVQLRPNTSFIAEDGILRIQFDGTWIFESTDMHWTDSSWTDDPATYQWVDWRIGQQLNGSAHMTEHRYIDDLSFASTEDAL